MKDFIHLHVHSHYSRGWGLGTPEELCRSAKDLGMDRLALTDTNGLYGLHVFLQAAEDTGIRPIVGSEVTADGRRAVLLVRDREGYANLCRILSDRHCHQDFVLSRALSERREGLIIFSDDFRLLKALKRDSLEDLFVEMSPGYDMAACYAFSRKSGIPPLATNRAYLIVREQFPLHRILRAVALNTKLSRLERGDTCREHNFLNAPWEIIDHFPHAPQAVRNTLDVAERCLGQWDFSHFIFPRFRKMTDRDAFDTLYRTALEGCKWRYGRLSREVRDRVAHEMKIIREKNFAHYFLVVADMTRRAERSCGRGSAAASIVSYALGITHVDPIRHRLFFDRFLNPGRVDPPDIDVDFAWDERDQIIDYAFARYGARRTAMVANHNTYGARSAIREVAKVFGLTDAEIRRVTERVGYGRRLEGSPEIKGLGFKKPWSEILNAVVQLEDHFNHLSVHCGGLVVVPDEIRRYCPVEISAKGIQILQWEKDSVEDAGLVKIDILGNRSLAVIRDALLLVEKNTGRRMDYAAWDPVDDARTIDIFYRGETFGVFYFESPATRQVLRKVASGFTAEEYRRLNHFHINVVVTSIIRPASNQSIRTWISRLHGEPWQPPHPLLRPVLEETLGIMVFQEQLSQSAMCMAGFDAAEADTLRKVVSKKHKAKRLRDFHERFVKGARERGVSLELIEDIWRMMMGFDGYSFCKPHSASYTLVAYKSAWLRAHYPAEFMAAVISNGGGYYGTTAYLSESRRMGLIVLPPDINQSEIKYTGKGREIRVGLMQMKYLSAEALDGVVNERSKRGPFNGLEDFLCRTNGYIHQQDARILIKAGCFDGLYGEKSRFALMWKCLRFFEVQHKEKNLSLFSPTCQDFFSLAPSVSSSVLEMEGFKRPLISEPAASYDSYPPRGGRGRGPGNYTYPEHILLKHEMETLGLFASIHPLDRYRDALRSLGHVKAQDLHRHVGKLVTTVGWMVTGKTVQTKEGGAMKFVSFEDTTGLYEAVFFPKEFKRFSRMLNKSRPYVLKGKVEEDLSAITLTVYWIGFLTR